MDIDIINIKKTIANIKNLDEYNYDYHQNNWIVQAAAFDLMTNSEMKAIIILMGSEIEKLRSLSTNLELALDSEMKKKLLKRSGTIQLRLQRHRKIK